MKKTQAKKNDARPCLSIQQFDAGDRYFKVLTIDRAEAANSLNQQLIDELTEATKDLQKDKGCEVVILCAKGKNFCAGADLGWMRDSSQLSPAANLQSAKTLDAMFAALAKLPMPLIALCKGNVFGGGLGLAAVCDIVVTISSTLFCLSETKMALVPAIILPYLKKRLSAGHLAYLSLTAAPLRAESLPGLTDFTFSDEEDLLKFINATVTQIFNTSSAARRHTKELLNYMDGSKSPTQVRRQMTRAIAFRRRQVEAKLTLKAFLEKEPLPTRCTATIPQLKQEDIGFGILKEVK